jgi:ribosomal protein S6
VAVKISESNQIIETRIVNLMNGEEFYVNKEGVNDFAVDIPDLRDGHYVLRVVTNQSILSTHFFKQ